MVPYKSMRYVTSMAEHLYLGTYTLGQDMKRDALQWLRAFYRANKGRQGKEPRLKFSVG
jgi:hypothetical protein